MASNCEYFRTTAGILKSISIILVLVVLALSSTSYFTSEYTKNRDQLRPIIGDKNVNLWREILLIAAAAFCSVSSIANLAIHLLSRETYWNRKTGIYDFFFHAASFLLLGFSGGLTIISAVKVFEINCKTENECQQFELKLGAGALSMITGFIYGVIAAVVLTNRKEVERDGLLAD